MSRLMFGLPTLSRLDLLHRNYSDFRVQLGDHFIVVDNGSQDIVLPQAEVVRTERNLGIPGSWNVVAHRAVEGGFDGLVILSDDIRWDERRVAMCHHLFDTRLDVHLFLSYLHWSLFVLRIETFREVGDFDAEFFPGGYDDEDYAYRLHRAGKVWERFRRLDPLSGSINAGTTGGMVDPKFRVQKARFIGKWGSGVITGINERRHPCFHTNRWAVERGSKDYR